MQTKRLRPRQPARRMELKTVADVLRYAKAKVLWKLIPSQKAYARKLVRNALDELPGKFPHPNQVLVYQRVKEEYEALLQQLTNYD